MSTRTGDFARLVAMAATALAQAPVPQASVSPAPRSKVRSFRRSSNIGRDVDVDPLGKGRIVLDPRPELLERNLARVGDEENDVGIADIDRERLFELVPGHRQRGGVHRIGEREFRPSRSAAPASATSTSSPRSVALEQAAIGVDRPAPVSWTTQRVALPQLSTSPPSLFQIRILRSAVVARLEHDQLVAADADAAVGDRAVASAGVTSNGVFARVDDHEIIAEPMHLVEVPPHRAAT